MDGTPERSRMDPAGVVVAVLLAVLAGIVWWDMTTLRISSVYGVGPKAMPIVIAAGLALLAIGNVVMAWQGDLPARESLDRKAILLILGGLAAVIALMHIGGGFIPGITILFAATAAAFGRRAFLIDLGIGFVLAIVVYLLFVKLLTLSLPVGPLERLL